MNVDTLNKAVMEAQRFIKLAKAVPLHNYHEVGMKKPSKDYITIGKESAACRRASMDLTRALADLRRVG